MNDKTLKNNLKALKQINPNLYFQITNCKDDLDWCRLIHSENRKPNLLISHGAKIEPAYSMDDPKKDSRELLKSKTNMNKEDISIIVGLGLGYLTKAILNRMEKGHRIVIVEPEMKMILYAFSMYNFTKYIKSGEITIVTSKPELAIIIHFLDNALVVENWSIIFNKYARLRKDQYKEYMDLALELINQARCNTGTVMGNGVQIAENDIVNLPYVVRYRGVIELKDLYKGKPAVTVSTGPSLMKNIHELKSIKDKVIIIAVAQALRPLLAYDIRPDFICSVDFGKVNLSHLDGLMDSDVPLVILNRTYAPLLINYKGPKFIVATQMPGFEETASGLIVDRGSLDQGGSVAHLCLSLAYFLGCQPIMLTGQDLSYESDLSHTPLADTGGTLARTPDGQLLWTVTDHRSHLHGETKHGMGTIVRVPAYFGGNVVTNVGLASFITSFEAMGEQYSKERRLYNCTEGGAKLKNFIHRQLLDAFKLEYGDNIEEVIDINKSVINPLLSLRDDVDEQIQEAIFRIKKDIEIIDDIIKNTDQGLESNKRLYEIADSQPKGKNDNLIWTKEGQNKIIQEFKTNKTFSRASHDAAKKNPLVSLAIYKASRDIHSRELNVKRKVNHVLSHSNDLYTRLRANKMILSAANEASKNLRENYVKALDVLEKYWETKDESLLINQEPENINLDDAEKYFAEGNWAHPLLDARKIISRCQTNLSNDDLKKKAEEIETKASQMREEAIKKAEEIDKDYKRKLLQYNDLIIESRECGKKNDFKTALRQIKLASELLPDEITAKWGLATTYHFLDMDEESIEVYKELVEKFPENNILQFELGSVYLKTGQRKLGFELISNVMEKTHEYDSFFRHIGKLYMNRELYTEAVLAFEEYLKKFPADVDVWYNLSICYKKLEQVDKAKEALKKSKDLKFNNNNLPSSRKKLLKKK